jgi:hypothetical protein
MKGINTYKLCESKLLSAPICSLQSKEVKPQGQEQLANKNEKRITLILCDLEHLESRFKCEKENLSVCLHYQLNHKITSSVWQMALIDQCMKEKHHSLIEAFKHLGLDLSM